MSEHVSRADRIIQAIDQTLEEPTVALDQALKQAVEAGRMTQAEAEECMGAYVKAFFKAEEVE